ncbi:AI-2E family transporter [Aquabacterium sp.]|uniref:AI-2E family transporter n=1 Tax=Aquabacterium sp. TaxID=1872578 RepID=UPI002C61E1B2|nr:AI-2E family transporter [Aquabacterium sp.]HSW07263.1 AI-2E family transporter [Aquabacterium sp.]
MNLRLPQYAQLAAVVVVVVGCYQVLSPFIPALLFSAVACSSSWPLYVRLRRALAGRSAAAALLMTLLLVVLVVGPSAVLAFSLADDVTSAVDAIKALLDQGPLMPPDWLKSLPLIGEPLDTYWHRLAASREELAAALKSLIEPARGLLLGAGKAVGAGLLQLVLATFICFFFYRDGDALVQASRRVLQKLAGALGEELLATIDNTVTGVVHGIFGTALAQAAVAVTGFLLAGVPAALALGAATFLLSMVPIGPPLVWGGATIWLFYQGSLGWAIFMFFWGLLVISSIDNFVKPYLISRSSSLPLLLIVFGVFGGIIAFGFIGIFIGPPMLAVGLTLLRLWTTRPPAPDPAAQHAAPD